MALEFRRNEHESAWIPMNYLDCLWNLASLLLLPLLTFTSHMQCWLLLLSFGMSLEMKRSWTL